MGQRMGQPIGHRGGSVIEVLLRCGLTALKYAPLSIPRQRP